MTLISGSKRNRISELDVLRGVAALAVLLSHYTSMYDYQNGFDKRLGFDFDVGSYGVLLFFVISGFVIFMTLCKCKTGTDFVVSRFSRIFPTYWVAVLVTFSVLSLLKSPRPSLIAVMVNFTMLERFVGLPHLDAVYWTLNVELSFYCWMFFLFKCRLINKLNRVIALALVFQLGMSLFQTARDIHFSQGIQVVFLLEYIHLFCAGMLFYRIREQGVTVRSLLLLCWCLVNHYFIPFRWFNWIPATSWGIVAVLLIFVILGLVVTDRLSWIVSAPTLFLGTISYPLYLLHDEIGRAVMSRLGENGVRHWVGFGLALAFVLLLATSLTYLVEKPALEWIRKKYLDCKSRRISVV